MSKGADRMNAPANSDKIKKNLIIIGISVALTCLTLIMPCDIDHSEDLKKLRFGLPFPFLEQTSTLTPPEDWYPTFVGIENPLKTPTRFRLWAFLIDVIVFSQIFTAFRVMMKNRRMLKERE